MLKRAGTFRAARPESQPPSGGCVLKQANKKALPYLRYQPPSGGCVLKQYQSTMTMLQDTSSRLQAAVC